MKLSLYALRLERQWWASSSSWDKTLISLGLENTGLIIFLAILTTAVPRSIYVSSENKCWYFLGLEIWGLFICILWSNCFSSSLFLLSGSCTVFLAPTHTDPTPPVLSAPRDTLVSDSAALRGKFLQFWDQLNACSVANYFCERFGFLYNPSFTRKHSEVINLWNVSIDFSSVILAVCACIQMHVSPGAHMTFCRCVLRQVYCPKEEKSTKKTANLCRSRCRQMTQT